jgi:hypothetical protein
LEARFRSNRKDFEEIIIISEQDKHLIRVAPDFTWLDDDLSWPRTDIGLSGDRWDSYRRLFRQTGTALGWARPEGSSETFLIAYAWGLVTAGVDKGYVFSRERVAPILTSLDRPPTVLKRGEPAFKVIEGNWYIYYKVD